MQAGRTALHVATEHELLDMMELLLRHKASTEPENGRIALLEAAKYKRTDTVELLLKHKAEIDVQQERVMCAWNCRGKELE